MLSSLPRGCRQVGLLSALGIALGLAACSPSESPEEESRLFPITVQLDWVAEPDRGAFYTAEALGYFEEAGLNVTLHQDGPNSFSINKVATGHAQIGQADSTNVILAIEGGAPLINIASIFQHDPSVLMLPEENPIQDWPDLDGKTTMVRPEWAFVPYNEHSPQQAAGYLILAIRGSLTIASTASIPLSGFLVRAPIAPPSPILLSPPLFQRSSHPTKILLPIAPFLPFALAVTLLALLCSYISAQSSRVLVLDAPRIANVRNPYRIPIPPSRSHSVPLSLLSSPPTPSVLSVLSMPSDILPASLPDNVSPSHNAILALIRLFPPSVPSSFLRISATP